MRDISFEVGPWRFNYRVGALIVREDAVLVMRDNPAPYWYVPGGRVKSGETACETLMREMHEELACTCHVGRLVVIDENFFTDDASAMPIHELCLYFLTSLPARWLSPAVDCSSELWWCPLSALTVADVRPRWLSDVVIHPPDTIIHLVTGEPTALQADCRP